MGWNEQKGKGQRGEGEMRMKRERRASWEGEENKGIKMEEDKKGKEGRDFKRRIGEIIISQGVQEAICG